MKTKLFLIVLALTLLGGLAFAPFAQDRAQQDICFNMVQAGKSTISIDPATKKPQKVVIKFETPYCQTPIVVVTGGENISSVQIAGVTQSAASVLISVESSSGNNTNMTVYWQAMAPTQ